MYACMQVPVLWFTGQSCVKLVSVSVPRLACGRKPRGVFLPIQNMCQVRDVCLFYCTCMHGEKFSLSIRITCSTGAGILRHKPHDHLRHSDNLFTIYVYCHAMDNRIAGVVSFCYIINNKLLYGLSDLFKSI